jgi:hypothetical protein
MIDQKEKTMEQKPIILEMDEAKRELIQCVNDILQRHGLNCYLIEPMFAELYTQIKASAQNELAQARAAMAKDGAE